MGEEGCTFGCDEGGTDGGTANGADIEAVNTCGDVFDFDLESMAACGIHFVFGSFFSEREDACGAEKLFQVGIGETDG